MIDQNLISQNSNSLLTALVNSEKISAQIRFIKNAFDQSMLDKLQKYLDTNFDSDLWVPETTAYGRPVEHLPRHKIAWDPESVVEEIHEVCQILTPVLQQFQSNTPILFDGITLWRDQGGYDLDWHTDNPAISLTMQIYLNGALSNPGTQFKTDLGIITAPFVPNTGYLIDQRDFRPLHRLAHAVPKNQIRYSLFAIWKNVF